MAYIFKKSKLKMTGLYIVYNAGSIYEQEGQSGTRHILEHLICKNFEDEYDTLQEYNISWNAYTSDEFICIHFTGLESSLTSEFKERLVKKILKGITCNEEDFEAEKKIILQEYNQYFADPMSIAIANYMRLHYNDYSAIGKRDDIVAYSYSDAIKDSSNIFPYPAKIIEIGSKKTSFFETIEYKNELSNFKLKYKKAYPNIVFEKEIENKRPFIFISKPYSKKETPAMIVLCNMLAKGLASPFYKEIREKRGLSYGIYKYPFKYIGQSVMLIGGISDDEHYEEACNILKECINNAEVYLTEERLNVIKNNMKCSLKEEELFLYENPGLLIHSKEFCRVTIKDIDKITLNDVKKICNKYLKIND